MLLLLFRVRVLFGSRLLLVALLGPVAIALLLPQHSDGNFNDESETATTRFRIRMFFRDKSKKVEGVK